MKKIIAVWGLVMAVCLSACHSGPVVTRSVGFAYEVLVVMDLAQWQGAMGEAVNENLSAPIPYLPQPEPCMKVSYTQSSEFSGFLKLVRNILIVDINPDLYTKVSLSTEKDTWASSQVVLRMKAPNDKSVVDYLAEQPSVLTDYFSQIEMDRAVALLEDTYSSIVMNVLRTKHNLELKVPEEMEAYKDTTDFFWTTNNANTGRMDMVVYTFPYTSKETFTPEYLVAKRDSVMKANLPGSFPNSYMATEARAGVGYSAITVNGKYCGVMRGLWKVVGDMMGGPFVSHIRLDEENQRVVVVEGFVYAPETNKRNYIRRLEAALFTLRLPGEFEASSSGEESKESTK